MINGNGIQMVMFYLRTKEGRTFICYLNPEFCLEEAELLISAVRPVSAFVQVPGSSWTYHD